MVMTSGSPPYNYDFRPPFRATEQPYSALYPVGFSGVLLEQAEFLITAELRKFQLFYNASYLPNFYVYVNDNIPPSGPYEPKSNGSTVSNFLNPSVVCINKIDDARTALDELFDAYGFDTLYEHDNLVFGDVHKTDWLRQAYPNSPSGFNPVDYFGVFARIGDYLRPVATDVSQMTSSDLHYLGGSGIFLDVDFGEIMFQPYPYVRSTAFDNMQPGSLFRVQCSPIFPAFQKTNGNLITTNGREPTRGALQALDGITPISANAEHVVSGYIRLDGYCLHPSSTYMFASHVRQSFAPSNTNDFTYYTGEPRFVTLVGDVPVNDISLRAYIDPTAHASGVFRFAVKNTRQNFPLTAVESGVISVFPPENQAYPSSGVSNNVASNSKNIGYHVFDDAIWVTSRGGGSSMEGSASGLALMSPWTGHMMWVMTAEMTPSRGTADSSLGQTINDFNGFSIGPSTWEKHIGLARGGSNVIVRCEEYLGSGTTGYAGSASIRFQRYDSDLDYLGETETIFGAIYTGGIPAITDIDFDGTNYLVSLGATGGGGVYFFDSSFGFVSAHTPKFALKHAYNGSKYLGFSPGTSGINEVTFTGGGVCTLITTKDVNGAPFVGNKSAGGVHDITYVSGGTHIPDGTYAIIGWGSTGSANQSLYLCRIEEAATTWEIVGFYDLSKTGNGAANVSKVLDIIYLAID